MASADRDGEVSREAFERNDWAEVFSDLQGRTGRKAFGSPAARSSTPPNRSEALLFQASFAGVCLIARRYSRYATSVAEWISARRQSAMFVACGAGAELLKS